MSPTEEKEVQGKLDAILQTATDAKEELRKRTAIYTSVMVLFTCILITLLALAIVGRVNSSNNRRILHAIEDATSPEAQARQAAALVVIKRDVGIEVDCRSRRQQARIPAPLDATKTCAQQTDPAIFPGVAGVPARG